MTMYLYIYWLKSVVALMIDQFGKHAIYVCNTTRTLPKVLRISSKIVARTIHRKKFLNELTIAV